MKIVLAQINPKLGDIAGNTRLIAELYETHKDACELIVLPELSLTGCPPDDWAGQPAVLRAVVRSVEALKALSANGGAGLLVSVPWQVKGITYNALLLLAEGEIMATMPKHHLANDVMFDEARVFYAGGLPEPVDFAGHKIGFMTCEDILYGDVAGRAAQRGATMLIVASASPYAEGELEDRIETARKRVAETGVPLLYVNLVGGQDDLVFDGCSFGMNSDGSVAFGLEAFKADLVACSLDVGRWSAERKAEWPKGYEAMYEALKLGLYDYVEKNNFPGVVLGLSGGIDSALVAVLAVEALGAGRVHTVMMPSPYTTQMSLQDAERMAERLGVSYESIAIDTGMNAVGAMLGERAFKGVTAENIQARLRGLLLMGISNSSGYLLLTTSNKSEIAVGYGTLYGDMCGGFAPLKDVYKTDVYGLSRWLNGQSERIVERIITRPASAELRENQTDEDNLPPYDVLDDILTGLIEQELDARLLVERGHEAQTVLRVLDLLNKSEFKRAQSAIGTRVSRKAFGRGRRYPISNAFKLTEPLEQR